MKKSKIILRKIIVISSLVICFSFLGDLIVPGLIVNSVSAQTFQTSTVNSASVDAQMKKLQQDSEAKLDPQTRAYMQVLKENPISDSVKNLADKNIVYRNGKAVLLDTVWKSGLKSADIAKISRILKAFNNSPFGKAVSDEKTVVVKSSQVSALSRSTNRTGLEGYGWWGFDLFVTHELINKIVFGLIAGGVGYAIGLATSALSVSAVCVAGVITILGCAYVAGMVAYRVWQLRQSDIDCGERGALFYFRWNESFNVRKIC